jgi:hypothetical protein
LASNCQEENSVSTEEDSDGSYKQEYERRLSYPEKENKQGFFVSRKDIPIFY